MEPDGSSAPVQPARRIPLWSILVLILGVPLAIALVFVGYRAVDSLALSRGDAADEPAPPSERAGRTPTTSPDGLNRDEFGIVGENDPDAPTELFTELGCVFSGTSMMEPPLPLTPFSPSGPHAMSLEPGASFECADGTKEESAGTISLDATFKSMTVLKGVASGTGQIDWSRTGPSAGIAESFGQVSNTAVEVELDVPVIVVWTTILDGPYAGYKGRLVLEDWEQIYDDVGDITGVRFAPTSATFSPG